MFGNFQEFSCASVRNLLKSESSRHRKPVIQMLASSGLFAIRSNTMKLSPWMMENAQSSGTSSRSMVRKTSVFFPDLTSLMDERGTRDREEELQFGVHRYVNNFRKSVNNSAMQWKGWTWIQRNLYMASVGSGNQHQQVAKVLLTT